MDHICPEETVRLASNATATLESTAILDARTPDIGDTFTTSSSSFYEQPARRAVQPILPKLSFTMPPLAIEQIQKWKPTDAAGILPDINRAYFVVENRLYLWDYVEKKDIDTYEDTAPIVGIGLVPPKADVFNPSITHVLVVATTMQINVIAIAFKREHPAADRTNLTFYRTEIFTSASGEMMNTIIGTKNGRIFMLSNTGNVWELSYRREEGWFTSRCSKQLRPPISSFTSFLSVSHDPCIYIAVSEDGRVFYQLFKSSAIQVTYLGDDGNTYTNVYKCTNIAATARIMYRSAALLDNNEIRILSIHPTSPAEAKSYQLVAVTSTGCRLYFTHQKTSATANTDKLVPITLELVHVRGPPNLSQKSTLVKSFYNNAVLLLVEEANEKQSLVAACPNIGRIVTQGAREGFPEFTNREQVHGRVISIAEMKGMPFKLNDLTSQLSDPARHFLIFTTYGMHIVTKQRPVDMLQNLLTGTGADVAAQAVDYESFFSLFGFVHSCALCFNIICSASTIHTGFELQASAPVSLEVAKGATRLLETLGQAPSDFRGNGGETTFSSRHDGLALFIYRLIEPLWTRKIVIKTVQGGKIQYSNTVPRDRMLAIQQTLRKLQSFMDLNVAVYPQTQPRTPEEHSLRQLYHIAVLITEAISFILYLLDSDVSKVVSRLKPEAQARFENSTFKDLLTTVAGQALCSDLAQGIIDDNVTKYNNIDVVMDILEARCGSFCNASEVLLYRAMKLISSSATTSSPKDLQEGLKLLKRSAGQLSLTKLKKIVDELTSQKHFAQAADLALACARARDPHLMTNVYIEDGCPAGDPRAEVFQTKQPFYDIVFHLLKEAISPSSASSITVSAAQKDQLFQQAFGVEDFAFQYYIYEKFLENSLGDELIKMNPPNIERFLKRPPADYVRCELLADYYRLNNRFDEAAQVLEILGRADIPISIDKRLEYLTRASMCAKCVTAPSKQFEMLDIRKRLDDLIKLAQEEKRQQQQQ